MKHIIEIESDISTGEIVKDIKETLGFEARALEQDKLIELPCKVGDTVYYIDEFHDEIMSMYIRGIEIYKKQILVLKDDDSESEVRLYVAEFGKTVFFTKEQAEKALKEMCK